MRLTLATWVGVLAVFALTACSTLGDTSSTESADDAPAPAVADAAPHAFAAYPANGFVSPELPLAGIRPGWRHQRLPGKKVTQYRYSEVNRRPAISAYAVSSASMLRHVVRAPPEQLRHIEFSWKVPQLIAGADLSQRDAHDSPVRIAMGFDGDRSKLSSKNAMLSELAHALTGEPLPYATLMYVWCNQCTPGAVLVNPRTDRIREIVLESGPDKLGQWQSYRRDVHADFERAFGEPPGALFQVGLMTDTDNTQQSATAQYGPISLGR